MMIRTASLIAVVLFAGTLAAQTSAWEVESGFTARQGHASVVFNGRMWVIGGMSNGVYENDIWSSANGADWSQEIANAAWDGRHEHACVVYNNRIWVIGGMAGATPLNDVWSSADGINWNLETSNAGWTARKEHTVTEYNGELWLMGGTGGSGIIGGFLNDIWTSTDGANWTQQATPPWPGRTDHAAAVFNGDLYVMGGMGQVNYRFLADVWAYDGTNWLLQNNAAWDGPWGPRLGHAAMVHNNELWVVAGHGGWGYFGSQRDTGTVMSTPDGVNWTVATTGFGWSPRSAHTGLVFNNSMWVIGGIADGWNGGIYGQARLGEQVNDVWHSTSMLGVTPGAIWAEATPDGGFDGWKGRVGHTVEKFGNKLWVVGGKTAMQTGGYKNMQDVWSSIDGISWTEETANAAWAGRYDHATAVLGNEMFVMGGSNGSVMNDVWSSTDGINWGQLSPVGQIWSARRGHTAVVMNGRIWVMGGFDGAYWKNDVWSSPDGINWTSHTSSAGWAPRGDYEAVVFNGRIWVMGGWNGANYFNDIWSSSDGANWTLETAAPKWSYRFGHSVTVAGGRMWLAGGKAIPPSLWAYGLNYAAASEFRTSAVGVPSGEQSLIVAAASLNADLEIIPPANFEVALAGGTFQSTPLSISPNNGFVATTTIRVRYSPTQTGLHQGNLDILSSGVTRQFALQGSIGTGPAIKIVGGILPFSATSGMPTAEQTYTVEASNLTADLQITVGANFEIALTGGNFGSAINLTPTAGTVATTTVRIRYNRPYSGSRSGLLKHSSAGIGDQVVGVTADDVGANSYPRETSDLWSSADGVNWVAESQTPWSSRIEHRLAEFMGAVWMLGGGHIVYSGVTYGDVVPFAAEVWRHELPVVQLTSVNHTVAEAAGQINIDISLNHAYAFDVGVAYGTFAGTATTPGDYASANGFVTIPAGQTTASFSITINDDQIDEPDETLQVVLSNPLNTSIGAQSLATVQILDDDGAPTVRFTSATSSVSESGGSVIIDIELSNVSAFDVDVDFATVDVTAVSGQDYTSYAGTAAIVAGQLVTSISVPVSADAVHEGNEDFRIELSNPVNGTLGALSSTTVTIVDDDAVPTVGFVLATLDVEEQAGSVPVELTLSHPSAQAVSIGYSFVGGTAQPGADFSNLSGTVTFNPGEVSKTFAVDVLDDVDTEPAETFQVTLMAPTGCSVGTSASLSVTILEDPMDITEVSKDGGSAEAAGCAASSRGHTTWLLLFMLGIVGIALRRQDRHQA